MEAVLVAPGVIALGLLLLVIGAPGDGSKSFFALPAWGRPPPRFLPYRAVRALAALNAGCARLSGTAPLGAEMCPQVLDSMALHHRKEGGRAATEALEIASETSRSVDAGIRDFVARVAR
jgi:hypothetical protein